MTLSYSWFLHILSYVTHLLPAFENKDKFITDLISKWQTYLLALLEDYDPVSSTDAGVFDDIRICQMSWCII